MKHNFKYYCEDYENIENYQKAAADNFIGWDCHHRLETHNSDGERRPIDITQKELISIGMYYDRPASELIFIKHGEHRSLHNKGRSLSEETRKKLSEASKGKKLSEETRNKMSEARKGKYTGEKNPMYGRHHTEDSKKRISAASKGRRHTEEARKKMSDAAKGKPKTKEHKKKIAEAARINSIGRHWYNNGKENKFCYECPEGFVPGMLK